MSNVLTQDNSAWALFLDIDGTLLEIAETPDAVRVPEQLNGLLNTISVQLEGALALVSGRTLQDIDALLAPYRCAAAGLHGAERRDAVGCVHHAPPPGAQFELARERLKRFVAPHPGLLLEEKHAGLAVHYRRATHLEAEVEEAVLSALKLLGAEFVLQRGKCVREIRPRAFNKGVAVEAFMCESPFRGRRPIYIGDDVTDEDAFVAVNQLQGVSIKVGEEAQTVARFRLGDVSQVHRWLRGLAARENVLDDLLRYGHPVR